MIYQYKSNDIGGMLGVILPHLDVWDAIARLSNNLASSNARNLTIVADHYD